MGFRGWNSKSNNKYGARKAFYKGIEFDSTVERSRFIYLEHQVKIGEISQLHRQVSFEIIKKLTKIVPKQLKTKVKYEERVVEKSSHYTADFVYREGDVYVMEDIKNEYSQDIRDYPLRRKLMMWKIKKHNEKGRGQWIFRESVYSKGSLKIKDIKT